MALNFQSYSGDNGRHPLFWPFVVSILGHLLLVVVIVINPRWNDTDDPYLLPGAISVQMVGPPDATGGAKQSEKAGPAQAPEPKQEAKPEPVPEKEEPQELQAPPPVEQPPEVEPEISIAPKQPKIKTALKYKTIKSKEVLQQALKQLEQKVDQKSEEKSEEPAEEAPSRKLQDTLKRLKDQVAKEEKGSGTGSPGTGQGAGVASGEGKSGGFGQGGEQEPELIDLYRLEVAYQIQKNWAYADQLGGGGAMMAMIVFKVMADGTIEDIFFTDRSGNAYLDDSAYRAIAKSSPVKPHPPGLARPYIEMGLRFTPQGIR